MPKTKTSNLPHKTGIKQIHLAQLCTPAPIVEQNRLTIPRQQNLNVQSYKKYKE